MQRLVEKYRVRYNLYSISAGVRNMEFLYLDKRIAVCVKPAGVLATDEPGGLPELVRQALGDERACVRTVHRLDRVVGGLTVLARSARAASELSRQIREGTFHKEYLAVVNGCPEPEQGRMEDLLRRDRRLRMTFVASEMGKDVRPAALEYERLGVREGKSLVRVRLLTGRTHQIRCQFASRNMPLAGDRKYGAGDEECPVGLWSYKLRFIHPESGETMEFMHDPPDIYPFSLFLPQT